MKISLNAEVRKASSRLKQYQRKQLPAATTRALNRTLRGTVTDTKKLIASRINMTQANIGKDIKSIPASVKTGNRFVASMRITGNYKKRNIASFKGLKKIKKGLSGKPWKTRVKYLGAFVWTRKIKSGDTAQTAFHRVKGAEKVAPSKGRYAGRIVTRGKNKGRKLMRQPIKPLFGSSVVDVYLQENGTDEPIPVILSRTVPARFEIELERQLARISQS